MKKTLQSVLVIVFLLVVPTSCITLNRTSDIRTEAYPLNPQKAAQQKLIINNSYGIENVLAYTMSSGETRLQVFSAPLEDSRNNISPLNDAEYIGMGQYLEKRLPEVWSQEHPICINDIANYVEIYPAAEGEYTSIHKKSTNAFGQSRDTIIYEDAFGAGVDLKCSLTTFGLNMEIMLSQRPTQNRFYIQIRLPEVYLDINSPDYILFRNSPDVGDVRSIIYTPLAVDSVGQWSYTNSVRATAKNDASGIYTVEYVIDESFLQESSTRYPVTMNQSIHIHRSKQPDVTAYQYTGDKVWHFLSPYMLLGDSGLKGDGWTYIRYETLNSINISADKITSAKYIFHNLFDLPEDVTVGAYAVTAEWCSINTRWDNRPTFDEKPVAQTIVKQAGDYALDVTPLVQEMIRNKDIPDAKYSVRHSFMIRCDTPGGNLIFPSGDNGLFSPFMEVVIAK